MFQAGTLFDKWNSDQNLQTGHESMYNQEFKQTEGSIFGDSLDNSNLFTLNKCSKINHGPPGL